MSATIGTFYERVSRAIRRSTVYDDDIPGYAADAVRELENQYDWKHMWNEVSDNLTISTTVNRLTPVLTRVKNIRFIKTVADGGDQIPLRKTLRENVTAILSGRPGAYWMVDKDTVGLDSFPDKAYAYEMGYFRYSETPLKSTLPWLTISENLLIAKTILAMQPILRDDALVQRWGRIVDTVLPPLLESEVVSEVDGQEGRMVPFTLEVEEDMLDLVTFS